VYRSDGNVYVSKTNLGSGGAGPHPGQKLTAAASRLAASWGPQPAVTYASPTFAIRERNKEI